MLRDSIAIFLAAVTIGMIYAFENPAGIGKVLGTFWRAFSLAACGS